MRDKRLEETIELIEEMKKDIKKYQNIQNEDISYDVEKSLQQIVTSLEDKIYDKKAIDNIMKQLNELKGEINAECDKKSQEKYESISLILEDYLEKENSIQEDEMFQNKTMGITLATLDEPQCNISLKHIEDIITDKLIETRRTLMRAGVSDEIIDDIERKNKYLMRNLIDKIDENVYLTKQTIDTTVEAELTGLFSNVLEQDEYSKDSEQLSVGDIFKDEDKKSWELTDEEKIDFREGEEKVLEDLMKKPQEKSRQLDSRGIFDE